MMAPGDRDRLDRLDREQLLADLDQAVGVREQVIADDRQRELLSAQASLDAELRLSPHPTFAESVESSHQQAEHDRTQSEEDARQARLDATQDGRDDRQEVVDDERGTAPTHADGQVTRARASRRRRAAMSARGRAADTREHKDAPRTPAADAIEPEAAE
jgi:hypothetical protein